jgi:ribosomal protein S18 acetylase RimI-like enzyme
MSHAAAEARYSLGMLGAKSHVVIRKAGQADSNALSEVFKDSWRQAYRGVIPHLHLEAMIRKRSPEWWAHAIRSGEGILALEACGRVGGYATWGPARIRGAGEGEIYELYITPTYQGLGFGELLFEAARHRLEVRRLRGLLVWALVENEPATAFYWRRGGRPALRSHDRFGKIKLEKAGFVWT